jgi:hypothetical protein
MGTRSPPRPSVPRTGFGAARRRERNRSLVRDGIVVLLVLVGLGVTWSVREVPNEDLPPALELTRRFDEVFRAVRAGDVVLETVRPVAPGIEGGLFERSTRGDRWVLTGEAGGECYVLWWDEAGVQRVRVLSAALPCEPSTDAMSARPGTFDRTGRAVEESETAAWGDVLPQPTILRIWFLPVLIVGGGLGLAALVRMTIAVLTGDAPSATRR